MAYGPGYIQARELRNIAAAQAIALYKDSEPANEQDRTRRSMAFTALVKAWEAACDRMRIANGTPLPGSRRPGPRQSQRSVRRGLAPDQPRGENGSPSGQP